jgi:hypothetical protein
VAIIAATRPYLGKQRFPGKSSNLREQIDRENNLIVVRTTIFRDYFFSIADASRFKKENFQFDKKEQLVSTFFFLCEKHMSYHSCSHPTLKKLFQGLRQKAFLSAEGKNVISLSENLIE